MTLNRAERRARRAVGRHMSRGGWTPFAPGPLPDVSVYPQLRNVVATWRNNLFAVLVADVASDWGLLRHVMIRRHTAEARLDWAERQRIKTELFGPDSTAIEVYPASADLVDVANMYHLWILPEGFALPFTLRDEAP